jgi:hypothetical protein
MTVHFLCDPTVRIRVITQRPQIPLAEEAVATRNREGNNHAIADLYILHRTAEFDNFPHKFMTQDVP